MHGSHHWVKLLSDMIIWVEEAQSHYFKMFRIFFAVIARNFFNFVVPFKCMKMWRWQEVTVLLLVLKDSEEKLHVLCNSFFTCSLSHWLYIWPLDLTVHRHFNCLKSGITTILVAFYTFSSDWFGSSSIS